MEALPLKKSEIDIVRKLSKGITVPVMADEMDKNKRSIETTLDKLRKRYKCKTIAHLVATFIREGIIK
jgi:DNA-binding CsgD family transcriptional regulator